MSTTTTQQEQQQACREAVIIVYDFERVFLFRPFEPKDEEINKID